VDKSWISAFAEKTQIFLDFPFSLKSRFFWISAFAEKTNVLFIAL